MIRPSIDFLEPGFFALVYRPSLVTMNVKILAPDGKILDEIVVTHGTSPKSGFSIGGIPITNMASGSRLRSDGAEIGRIVGKYLRMRVSG